MSGWRKPVGGESYDAREQYPTPAPKMKLLDDSWYQWMAECRLRDCSPQSMVEAMVQSGVPEQIAQNQVLAIETNPVYLAARRMQQLHRKLESIVGNQQKVWESSSTYMTVDKRSKVSRDEFIERYMIGSRPVVLTDLANDWLAMERWTPTYLADQYGSAEIEIQDGRNSDPAYEVNKLQHRARTTLGAFVQRVLDGGLTNDYYMTANNDTLRKPALRGLLSDIGSLPSYVDAAQFTPHFWFGPAGTLTPVHHDTVMLMHTQIFGRKRWRLISPLQTPCIYNHDGVFSPIDLDKPDLAKYPKMAELSVLDVTVEPGETIFLPLAWWHQVTSLEVSISVSYTNFDCGFKTHQEYVNPEIRNW